MTGWDIPIAVEIKKKSVPALNLSGLASLFVGFVAEARVQIVVSASTHSSSPPVI
jgi:hypothetical protein